MDILEAISRRVSVRNYQPEPASPEDREAVLHAGETAGALTPAELRFHLCPEEQIGGEVDGIFGDYGKVIDAPHFVVLAARESPGYLTDSGYRFEQMVLEATRRGLGTCWVGGMFKETSVRAVLKLDASWRVVALTPLGRPAGPGIVSRTMSAMVGSRTRKPLGDLFFWRSHGQPLPADVLADERLARVLEATRWAPSWANKQPWRFIISEREVLVYKQMRQIKDGKDYHFLDCGIAMAHLHLAARAVGIGGKWELAEFDIPDAPGAEPVGRFTLEIPLK